jgi:hypothetical protein
LTDFASDVPLQGVPGKLRKHYGIELYPKTVRKVTLNHAEKMQEFMKELSKKGAISRNTLYRPSLMQSRESAKNVLRRVKS